MQFEIFAGIDWSTKVHEVAVADAGGEVLGARFIIGASGQRPFMCVSPGSCPRIFTRLKVRECPDARAFRLAAACVFF